MSHDIAITDPSAITAALNSVGARCPVCAHSTAGLPTPICTECGTAIQVRLIHPSRRTLMRQCVALGVALGTSGMLLFIEAIFSLFNGGGPSLLNPWQIAVLAVIATTATLAAFGSCKSPGWRGLRVTLAVAYALTGAALVTFLFTCLR